MKLQKNTDNLRATAMKTMQASFDSVLETIGLQLAQKSKGRTLPLMSAFGAGLIVGGGTALLFAPMRGSALRARIMSVVGLRSESTEHSPAIPTMDDGIADNANHVMRKSGANSSARP